ncbi:MAG: TrkA family potassium uptake protein, partial [Acetanaerobacterium sp.]
MNVLIIGCRKVGSRLASILSAEGHTVSVVDRDMRNFEALDNDFDGYTVSGIPIDEDVLRSAGIESCDAVAAVTPDDNVNIMACQIAKELFHVPIVITRMYDPAREEIFSDFGISTVCPTNLTVNAV